MSFKLKPKLENGTKKTKKTKKKELGIKKREKWKITEMKINGKSFEIRVFFYCYLTMIRSKKKN